MNGGNQMGQFGGQPIFVLSEDAMRQTGRDAQSNNIAACKAIGSAVRTTLGPRGMDKMMVDSVGDVIVTNDGVTILDEMEVEHPAAKMMVEVAKTQDEEVGDGTTTAVVIAGELLKKAENLLEQEIHPTVIASGYRLAREKAIEALHETGQPVSFDDQEQLGKVAMTAMTGKSAEANKKALSQIAVDAVRQVAEQKDDELDVDLDMIKLEKKQGGSVQNTNLIQGVALDKEKVHSSMPSKIDDAKIALLDVPVEIKETETDAEISITDPNQLQQFIEQEENTLKQMVEQIKAAGANVVLCQKGIDDVAQHFMAKEGIFAVRRVKQSDMAKLANATGGTVVTSLKDLDSSDLGSAGIVEQRKVAGDNMVFVRECQNPKAVTVLVRGGTEHVVDEIERSMDDAIGGVVSALRLGKVVGGGGAPEVEVAKKLREYADAVEGREQLAITAFAEALEVLPRTLAENAGLDPIDMLVEMRNAHDRGEQWAGVNVFTGHVEDLNSKGVVEPLQIKTQAIGSASESAEMILRIDDVISSSGGQEGADAGGGGMPPGAMGM